MNRADIRTLAEVRSDTDGGNFPQLAQKNLIINDEARKLYARMLNAGFPGYRDVVSINATGASAYPLSLPRLLRITAVRDTRFIAHGHTGSLRRANSLDRNVATHNVQHPNLISDVRFDVELNPATGWQLKLFPPTTTGLFNVEALQGHPGFIDDTTEWFGPDPSVQALILASAIRFKQKEDEDSARPLIGELQETLTELWSVCSSLAPPQQMEDWVSLEEMSCHDGSPFSW